MKSIERQARTTAFFFEAYISCENMKILIFSAPLLEAHRRATRLRLAMVAWRLDRGAYPRSIDELREAYLQELPLDPFSGEPFGYYPEGIPVRLQRRFDFQAENSARDLAPSTPFLWSTSTGIKIITRETAEGPVRYLLRREGDLESRSALLQEYDAPLAGEIYPLPK